jgi:hypothetical protein
MRFISVLLIIGVAILAVYMFWPAKFTEGKDWVTDQVSGLKSTNGTQEALPDDDMVYVNPKNDTVLVNESHSVPVIIKNACNYTHYGKPNYDGTTKAGQGCDTAYSNNDLTCIANAPKNYDGTIDKINQISMPAMTCCMEDGTCQWSS